MVSPTAIRAFDASRYPRAYTSSVANRVIWISFGGLLIGFGAILTWLLWRGPEQLGPYGPAVVMAISGMLALLGGYLILSMLFSKVILTPDAVEVRSLLSSQTMLRQEIAGRRFLSSSGTLELIPRSGGKKLKIALLMKTDSLFSEWFDAIPDLDSFESREAQMERQIPSRSGAKQQPSPSPAKRRTIVVVVLLVLFGPFFLLHSPSVSQAQTRMTVVGIWALGVPVAIFWFGLKSPMIRPGGKLYEVKYDRVRPKIERNIRLAVLAFGVFYLLVLSLPFAEDLIRVATTQTLPRVRATVMYARSGNRSPSEAVGLSGEKNSYNLFYPSKPLRIGNSYEFVVLPKSRMILDYDPK